MSLSSPPFNYGLHAQTAGHTLWQDKRGRTNLWPGEAVLIGMVTYNNTEDPDVALLNVFGRMLSLLPHEVLLRPRFKCNGPKDHRQCYDLPGRRDLVEEIKHLENYVDRSVPLRIFPALYCPCGFEAHAAADRTISVRSDEASGESFGVMHAALAGNLGRLCKMVEQFDFLDPIASQLSTSPAAAIQFGFLAGGHSATLFTRLMEVNGRQRGNKVVEIPTGIQQLAFLNSNRPEFLRAAVTTGQHRLLKAWIESTLEEHHEVLRALLRSAAPEWLIRQAIATQAGNVGDSSPENPQPLAVQTKFAALMIDAAVLVDIRSSQQRISLWNSVMTEHGFASDAAITEVCKNVRGHRPSPHVYIYDRAMEEFLLEATRGSVKPARTHEYYENELPRSSQVLYFQDEGREGPHYERGVSATLVEDFCKSDPFDSHVKRFGTYFERWPEEANRPEVANIIFNLRTVHTIRIFLKLVGHLINVGELRDSAGRTAVRSHELANRMLCVRCIQRHLDTHEAVLEEDEGMMLPF